MIIVFQESQQIQRILVFATNPNFLNPLSLHPYGVNFWYFKLRLFNLTVLINFKYLRYPTFGCKDVDIRKLQFVAKTQLL